MNVVGEIDPPLFKVEGNGSPAAYLRNGEQRRPKASLKKRLRRLLHL
jgi:hypothetical protein